eukprot:CAMPEP_0194206486 /NCGR_PEP_ID=MMETSP0156-20130528/5504_1 /TAXON_ID=33649 /ORGANISM="Thalassionema nitzschioides, Strain L26-B" /LENGTH=408 /DNA_ID=CAMNT_0038933019 /DNA_START=79 /DNA_END=1305 /DNA_ORIENTATION=-
MSSAEVSILPMKSNQVNSKEPDQLNTEHLHISIEDKRGQDLQLLDGLQFEEWSPDILAFILALIAISPFVSYVCYKMELAALPYLTLHLVSIPLAFKVRDRSGWVRWPTAFLIVAIMGAIKTSSIQLFFKDDSVAIKVMVYAFTALWECSNAVCVFGGKDLLDRFGIINYRRALFAVLCPVQIKFIAAPSPRGKWLRRSLHLGCYLVAFFVLRCLFSYVVEYVELNSVLEAEAIVISFSCLVNIWNIPPHIFQMCLIGYPVQTIYPYGSLYFCTSSRDFWSKWSRPASSLIRHMFYYPLGGRTRAFLSIPLMFLLNASSHYGVSEALVGDKSEIGWNTVFGVLCLLSTIEVYGNSLFEGTDVDDGRATARKWWFRLRFVLALAALRFAAYTLLRECLNSSLSQLLKYS